MENDEGMIGMWSIVTLLALFNECADEKRSGYKSKKKYIGKPHWIEYMIMVIGATMFFIKILTP